MQEVVSKREFTNPTYIKIMIIGKFRNIKNVANDLKLNTGVLH